jgi:hypothetical protein
MKMLAVLIAQYPTVFPGKDNPGEKGENASLLKY